MTTTDQVSLAPADFAQRVLQVVNEGSLTSTYKLALLLSLMDVCMERTASGDDDLAIGEIATKMVDLYWQQTLPYPHSGVVLRQSGTAGQAKIISLIQNFRLPLEKGEPITAAQAKILDPHGYQALVDEIEEQLYRYVLLKLQTIAGVPDPVIFELPVGADPLGQGSRGMFGGFLHLRPGVAAHLVRFEPLLRPLIQQRWAQHVAGLRANRTLRQAYELEDFLFGADRVSLAPVLAPLRELQEGRCFYCRKEVRSGPHVDHFIPWSRYRDNGLENLVFTDSRCNERKKAHLAALEHLDRWLDRFRPGVQAAQHIARIAGTLKWESAPTRTHGAAKTAYLYATPATLFWDAESGLRREDPAAVRQLLTAA